MQVTQTNERKIFKSFGIKLAGNCLYQNNIQKMKILNDDIKVVRLIIINKLIELS